MPTSKAAEHTTCATKMLNFIGSAPTATTLVQKNQASSQVLPIFDVVKALTRWLFGEAQLPAFLQQYGHLLFVLTGGAAVSSGLYHFFQKHKLNRRKVQLAVFHLVRMLETLPDLQSRLQEPQALLAQTDTEVMRMINLHLTTETEAASAIQELKRTISTWVDEQREQDEKRKKDNETAEDIGVLTLEQPSAEEAEVYAQALYQGEVLQSIFCSPPPEEDIQAELLRSEQDDVSMLDMYDQNPTLEASSPQGRKSHTSTAQVPLPPSWQGFSPYTSQDQQPPSSQGCWIYKYPSSSDSEKEPFTPTPAPQPKPSTSRSGYGFSYDDPGFYSSSSTSSSMKTPSTGRQSPQQQSPIIDEQLNSISNHPYGSPVLARPKTAKPFSTLKVQHQSNTRGVETGNKANSTRFVLIPKGSSLQDSPCPSPAAYRIANSKTFDGNVLNRKERRRLTKEWLEQVQQEKAKKLTPVIAEDLELCEEWPAPILTFSCSEEDDLEGCQSSISPCSPLASIDSPPLAPMISPPSPLSPREVYALKRSSPVLDYLSVPAGPCSSPTGTPTARHYSPPGASQTPTPPSTRPRRIVVGSSPIVLVKSRPVETTPIRPETRKNPKKSAYKGEYKK